MMDTLIIDKTDETPAITLNGNEGKFSFIGKSYPENVNESYAKAIDYITEYIKSPQEKTELEFNWIYFNTATSKMIVKIIMLLKTVMNTGKAFEIKWYCKPDDDLIIEKGEELKELLDVDFTIIHE